MHAHIPTRRPADASGSDRAEDQLARARDEIGHLKAALDSSRTIGIAIGIVSERYMIRPADAFTYLKRVSQNTNRKLRDIATEIVHANST